MLLGWPEPERRPDVPPAGLDPPPAPAGPWKQAPRLAVAGEEVALAEEHMAQDHDLVSEHQGAVSQQPGAPIMVPFGGPQAPGQQ